MNWELLGWSCKVYTSKGTRSRSAAVSRLHFSFLFIKHILHRMINAGIITHLPTRHFASLVLLSSIFHVKIKEKHISWDSDEAAGVMSDRWRESFSSRMWDPCELFAVSVQFFNQCYCSITNMGSESESVHIHMCTIFIQKLAFLKQRLCFCKMNRSS